MHRLFLASLLPLAGCNFSDVETQERAPEPVATPQALAPAPRPVRIGEGGPGFAACQSRGVVALPDAGGAAAIVRAAPFAEADAVVEIGDGVAMQICTRTLDQRWLGVVVTPASAPDTDCGVRMRIDRPRDYDGPCPAGWIAANGVRLTGS